MRQKMFGPVVAMVMAGCSQEYKVSAEASRFVVTPDLSDMGTVAVGANEPFVVSLSHVRGGDIELLAVEILNIEGEYFQPIESDPVEVLPSGETVELIFAYRPETEGYHTGRITFKTDAGEDDERTVEVRGHATQPKLTMFPALIDFGPVAVGSARVKRAEIINSGTVKVDVADVFADSAVFASETAMPVSIEPGERADVALSFRPETGDEVRSEVTVTLDSELDFGGLTLRGNACSTGAGDLYDQDGDGYSICGPDCDDDDAGAHPGAEEVCNGVDDDCDGTVDEGTECFDDDGDGRSEEAGDCNDSDASVHLGAEEDYENGIDDDCDGVVDSGGGDADGDGFSVSGGDCDDYDSSTSPAAAEIADGVDNDCDGTIDEGTDAYDDDGDGFTELDGDCDDSDRLIAPEAPEAPDWKDNNCDGRVDEGTIHADDDGDGFSELGGDCDDADRARHPGNPERVGDGIDNNCDGVTL